MNELEAWVEVEKIYEERGVGREPNWALREVCLASAIGAAARGVVRNVMIDRIHRVIGIEKHRGLAIYNDYHTKDENLAVIAQCRSECAAEEAEIEEKVPA